MDLDLVENEPSMMPCVSLCTFFMLSHFWPVKPAVCSWPCSNTRAHSNLRHQQPAIVMARGKPKTVLATSNGAW